MRRGLQKYLPIVLLALMVQILAPMAAVWAAAIAGSDPLGSAEICHSLPAPDSGPGDQDFDHRARDGACLVCCVAQAGSTLNAPQTVVVAMPLRAVAQVDWQEQISRQARSPMGAHAQARAPPLPM